MSVSDVICALECKISAYARREKMAKKHGDRPAVISANAAVHELLWLKFLVTYNNYSEADECFDNCLLNEKLECYGLSGLS